MIRKVYYDESNRGQLIAEAEALGERLKEDAITFDDGKYLIFTDEEEPLSQEEYIAELENQVLLLQNELTGGVL